MSSTGTRRYALLFALLFGFTFNSPIDAEAASWDWSKRNGRERIVINLDNGNERGQTVRDGTQSLAVRLENLPQAFEAQQSLPQNALVRNVRIDPATKSVRIDTNTPAFGFIVTTPGNGSIVLDVFPDALGARWRADGTLAPASAPIIPVPPELTQPPAPTPAPSAAPVLPATTQASSDNQQGQPAPVQTTPPSVTPAATPVPVESVQPPAQREEQKEDTQSAAPAVSNDLPQPQTRSPGQPAVAPETAPMPQTTAPISNDTASQTPQTVAPDDKQAGGEPSSPSDATLSGTTSAAGPAPVTATAQPSAVTTIPQPSATGQNVQNQGTDTVNATPQPTAQTSTVTTIPQPSTTGQNIQVQNPGNGTPQVSITITTDNKEAPNTSSIPVSTPPASTNTVQSNLSGGQPGASGSGVQVSASTPSAGNSGYVLSHAVTPSGEPLVSAPMNMGGPETWPVQPSTASGTAETPSSTNINISVETPGTETTVQTQPAPSTETTMLNQEASPGQLTPAETTTASEETQTVAPASDTASAPQTEPDTTATAENQNTQETQQTIYVDEQGNPVPPPPDIPKLLKDVGEKMDRGEYAAALPDLEILKKADLPPDQRENVLYNYMQSLYEKYHPNYDEHTEEVIDAANAAMNFNLDSYRVPEALSTLASVNLAVGNIEDAKGYVYLMRRKYQGNPLVPTSLLNLGKELLQRQDYAEASIAFSQILEEYPESKNAMEAGLLQVHSLYKQGHYDRALTLIEFVDRRWPRIYLEDEEYLPISADVEERQGKYDKALETYWKQYNLHPFDPTSPAVLMHIGELYYRTDRPLPAGKALEELVRAFPKSPEAPRALLLLGENGINDGNPELDDILAIFDKSNPRIPSIYYQRIIKDYPDSPEALPAKLRTIAWQYWNKEYVPAMDAARSFMIDYEDKPESLRAKDILLRAFAVELGNSLSEENYDRVLSLWERYPQVQPYYQPLEPQLRVALARAKLNRGDEAAGLELLAPFIDTQENLEYGMYAYNLYLSSYLRAQNWDGILELGEKVKDWNLPVDVRHQLDYAMALSAENLNLPGRALPLWKTLAPLNDIPLYQRAYANYFLARDAERRQDLRDAYQYNLDTLGMFTQLQDEQSPYADSERIRESIAALMDVTEIAGRYAEALDWAAKYAAFVPADSPDYAGLRFREARLHRKMGDTARWKAILQGIVDKEPDSVFGKMAASELQTSNVARDLSRFTGNN